MIKTILGWVIIVLVINSCMYFYCFLLGAEWTNEIGRASFLTTMTTIGLIYLIGTSLGRIEVTNDDAD